MSRTMEAKSRRAHAVRISPQRQCKLLCMQLFLLHASIVYLCLLHATHSARRRRIVQHTNLATISSTLMPTTLPPAAVAPPVAPTEAAMARKPPQHICQPTRTAVYFANHSRAMQFEQNSLKVDALAVGFMQRVASQWNAVHGTQTAVLVLLPQHDERNTSLSRLSSIFTSM
jgi:hypothetical protein